MIRLDCLSNNVNSFNTGGKFVDYNVVEQIDESGRLKYLYQRINRINNFVPTEGDDGHPKVVWCDYSVVDLGTFDDWVDDVLQLNHQRFIESYTDVEEQMKISHFLPLSMSLTKVAYLVRISLPFRKYNLDYSARERLFDIRNETILKYYRDVFNNPSIFRQTGKSLLSKSIFDLMFGCDDDDREIPKALVSTEGRQGVVDIDLSELYPKIVESVVDNEGIDKLKRNMASGAKIYTSPPILDKRYAELIEKFGRELYYPELVASRNKEGSVAVWPSKVYYYTEEDLAELPEHVRSKFVLVTLPEDIYSPKNLQEN